MKTATNEKPILFSPWKVRAIYNGATQTRRPVKPQPSAEEYYEHIDCEWYHPIVLDRHGEASPGEEVFGFANEDRGWKAPYQPGDVLWVRETWAFANSEDGPVVCYRANFDRRYLMDDVGFRCADGSMNYDDPRLKDASFAQWAVDFESGAEGQWRPSIHMPHWAARLFLEVTDVRVQRIQDISREDCHAEGLDEEQLDGGSHCIDGMKAWHVWMMDLWERQYPGSWQRNDWVWCYTFKRGK